MQIAHAMIILSQEFFSQIEKERKLLILIFISHKKNVKNYRKSLRHHHYQTQSRKQLKRERYRLKKKTISGWIEENASPFLAQSLNPEWLSHLLMKKSTPKIIICPGKRFRLPSEPLLNNFSLGNGSLIRVSKSEFEPKKGKRFLKSKD